ncbi:hypothetical protein LJ737_10360 [Hymenobacter sp. 15J16-1T3B]|uniref:hypothetical protein n=1 Tax=Hymenobacter sp. 15J16-1T3B TaxID=2886941 RepID=UPI001D1267FF|nr:hypothetical protein [Hymenobacter sp. 15J16-1T3B]MCC3157643.1 hypothetical protein [Hymenobacter sp. 15J16-1T3B]
MAATSRQTKLWCCPVQRGRGARGPARRWLLLLALLLGGLLRPDRSLAATAVLARQTNDALAAAGRHAVLPALLPGAEVAAPQPRPEPLPVLPALLPAPVRLPASHGLGPAPAPGQPAPLGRRATAARLTSEVPNGP